jgi:hypothetical protein
MAPWPKIPQKDTESHLVRQTSMLRMNVNARYVRASHLVSAAAHGAPRLKKAWGLGAGGTGITKGSDKSKLSNEKQEKTVIDLGKGGFGLGDELELLGLDLVPSM